MAMKLHCPATLGAVALVIFASTAVVAELPARPVLARAETAAIAAAKHVRTDAKTSPLLWQWETPFPGSHPFGPLPR